MAYKNILNGVSTSKVEVYQDGRRIINVTLPLTELGGLTESWDEVASPVMTLISTNTNVKTIQERKEIYGYMGNWELRWANYLMKAEDSLNVIAVMNKSNKGDFGDTEIYLTPRTDNPYSTRYKVNNMTGVIQWTMPTGEANAPGNKGITLRFRTVDMVTEIPAIRYFTIDTETPVFTTKYNLEGVTV